MDQSVFTNDQFLNIYPDGIENHYWNHARNAIIYRFIKRSGLNHERILEIGSGRGIVVKYLKDKGLSCVGVEKADFDPVAGIDALFYKGTDAFDLPHEKRREFTMIMLLDVIEHINEPDNFIQKIISAFPNVRSILITVPACQELWTNYDVYAGHYKRYNLADIKSLEEEQFKYTAGGYFNHILYPVFWLYAKLIRKRETVLKAPKGLQIVGHRILSWILQADYRLLPGKWKGTSVIAIYSIAPAFRQKK
jgi:2-polyprenyl-3-methyl-5-hydroxy-6-metoxy-1,4-benzoquinol methylase